MDHKESKGIPEKASTSASLITLKPLPVWTTTNWKTFKEMGILENLTCLLRNLYASEEAIRTLHEQCTGSKLGKKRDKAVYYHLAYLMSMQSTAREMPGWVNHKLEPRLLGERPTTLHMQVSQFIQSLSHV